MCLSFRVGDLNVAIHELSVPGDPRKSSLAHQHQASCQEDTQKGNYIFFGIHDSLLTQVSSPKITANIQRNIHPVKAINDDIGITLRVVQLRAQCPKLSLIHISE